MSTPAILKPVLELKPGDVFYMRGTAITVLKKLEPTTDWFGQDLFRLWCRREDTGKEGYCTFGPTGVVTIEQLGLKD